MNEIPRHERDVEILWRRMKIEARWERSPRKRKIFMVSQTRGGEQYVVGAHSGLRGLRVVAERVRFK